MTRLHETAEYFFFFFTTLTIWHAFSYWRG